MTAVDPFQVAQQLGNRPDPFALADFYKEFRPVMNRGGAGISGSRGTVQARAWGGEKFPGGFGATQLLVPDLWELRLRSAQLFTDNLYARGLIRRLLTNEINTGLKLQAEPIADLLPALSEEAADEWAEGVENSMTIWAKTPRLCDYEGRRTFAELQLEVRRESLIEGDVLVVLFVDRATGLPQIQLIRGGRVISPIKRPIDMQDRNIVEGVELDERGRQVAYWVRDAIRPQETRRIAARGPRSGRRLAWLVYGSDKRMDAVRGMPLLGLILQSLKELDRYRDSEQRAAVINSMLAMFIQKDENVLGTNPYRAGAVSNRTVQTTTDEGTARDFKVSESIPGVVMEELQWGEKPISFDAARPNVNYGNFESSVIQAIAWANEIPPEILTLAFTDNYAASKAAINEFKAYLTRMRAAFGEDFCQPIYQEWLTAQVTEGRIQAPGYLIARRNPQLFEELGAWHAAMWAGPMKPSVDLQKDVEAYTKAIDARLITKTRASEDLFGVRHTRVLKRLQREQRVANDMDLDPMPSDPDPVTDGASPSGTEPAGNGSNSTTAQESTGLWLAK